MNLPRRGLAMGVRGLEQKACPTSEIVIVITFYSPKCLGKETAKGPFGFGVNLLPAHLSTTHGGGSTLPL